LAATGAKGFSVAINILRIGFCLEEGQKTDVYPNFVYLNVVFKKMQETSPAFFFELF
jgi:hypothetical protein